VWVRKRKNRKAQPWVVYWDAPGRTRCQKTFAARTEAESFRFRKGQELEQARPASPYASDISVQEYAPQWLEAVAHNLKPRTIESYATTLKRYIYPALGAVPVRDLHQQIIASFLASLVTDKHLSTGTVRIAYATVRRMLSRAKFEGVVTDNAAASVWKELPVQTQHTGRKRTPADIKAMNSDQLAVFERHADTLFLTMSRTGLRLGEVLGLHIKDVDTVNCEIQVERNLAPAQRKGMSLEDRVGTPKSGAARQVEIGKELAETLAHHIVIRRAENLSRGKDDDGCPWLFSTEVGTPLDEARVRKAFRAILIKAKLPLRFTPHSTRHTYATLMLAKGAPLVWVAAQLGHSSPQVTLDWYSWALPQGEKTHANLLDTPQQQQQERAVANGSVASAWPLSPDPEKQPRKLLKDWSRRSGSNRGPADYEKTSGPKEPTQQDTPDAKPHNDKGKAS
jgi:integrase